MAISKFLRFSDAKGGNASTFLLVFCACLTVLNLLQGYFTEIHNDESYYWIYTRKLQWGYYDHPPMLALFERLGQGLIGGNLSIRVVQIILFPLAIGFFLREERNIGFLFAVILLFFSSPFLNYLTYMVFPDGPLLIFFLLFLYFLRKQLQEDALGNVLGLGLTLSLMLYSKYHAILILPFLVLANFHLLRTRWFYQVGILAFLLFIPHLIWQYQNEFVSFQFHLTGRSKPISLKYLPDFVGQQLGAVGPILILAALYKSENQFEKHLKVLLVGVLIFFSLISLRGFVHIQWTSLAYFPALYLSARYLESSKHKRRILLLVIPFLFVQLLLRLQLVAPIFPGEKIGANFVKGQKAWAHEISEVTGGSTLVYEHDLKEPSTYAFYSGLPSISFYPSARKSSQYALWAMEDTIQNKPALIGKKNAFEGSQLLHFKQRKLHYLKVDSFISYQNIQCEWIEVGEGESAVKVINHRDAILPLASDRPVIKLINEEGDRIQIDFQSEWQDIPGHQSHTFWLSNGQSIPPGDYVISIDDGRLSPSINSSKVVIED